MNRLKDKGLDKLCLPLFKYNADKKTFAKTIIEDRDSLSRMSFNTWNLDYPLIEREQHIFKLRQYALALGTIVDPLGKTVYWVHGELVRNKEQTVQSSVPWKGKDPLSITYEEYKKMITLFESIAPVYNIEHEEKHLHWKEIHKEHFSPDFVSRINEALMKIDMLLTDYQELSLKFFTLDSVQDLRKYLEMSDSFLALQENYFELDTSFELDKTHSLLKEAEVLAEGYSKLLSTMPKKYNSPRDYNFITPTEANNIFRESLPIEDFISVFEKWKQNKNLLDIITVDLKKIDKADILETTPLEELMLYKDIYNIDPILKSLKVWNTLIDLESANNQLHNLNTLYQRQIEIKSTFDKWGIITSAFNKEKDKAIADKFINKYSKFWRNLYSQYKQDCEIVRSWCNATPPTNYKDYIVISRAVNDWLTLDEKFNNLKTNFSQEHLKNDEDLNPESIPNLYSTVQKMIDILTSLKLDTIPNSCKGLLEANENFTIMSEIINKYEIIKENIDITQKYFIKDEIFSAISYTKIKEIYPVIENIFNDLYLLYQRVVNYLDKEEYPLTLEDLMSDINNIDQLIRINNQFNSLHLEVVFKKDNLLSSIINDSESYRDLIQNIENTKNVISIIKTKMQDKITIEEANNVVKESKKVLPELTDWYQKYINLLNELQELFGNNQGLTSLENFTFQDFSKIINTMKKDQEGLERWMLFRKYERQIREMEVGWFLDETKALVVENPVSLFAISLWNTWLESYYNQTQALKDFTVRDHTKIIKQFNNLEKDIMDINTKRILAIASKSIRETKWKDVILDKELVHQSQLQRQHKPIRKLVSAVGGQLIKYKQCWMMSPLTLSSYLPYGTLTFDVVIFDEASQMRVEHALGSIVRAKQVVIFGDENQLPPTSFFEVIEDEKENEEDEVSNDYESILHATKEILPGADEILSYHYRSSYEDLIAFSNHYIYDDNLITFPNTKNQNEAVEFVFVENGIFDGGSKGTRRNNIEAQKVAELCMHHAINDPNKSLGVIAFSKTQESAIRDALITLLKKYPHLQTILDEDSDKLEKFFIKNLESVQGDERDTIILSVGYGKDSNGNLYQRFGPITSATGFRRLNVAITRAKQHVICVSSIKATDIQSESKSRGVQLLQKYLDYAENGMVTLLASKLQQNNSAVAADSEFEEEVEKELQKMGMIVDRQVGASGYKIDLAIVNPNKKEYLLGIECDGAQYHSSYSARVNDRIRQENLERLGWKIYRIWSQHWILNKDQIIDDIKNSIV